MKTKVLGMIVLASWIGSVSAEIVVDYQFNDANGTGLSSVFNAGTDSGAFANATGATTDGAGVLNVSSGDGISQYYDLDSPIMSGMVTAAWTVASFDFSGTSLDKTDSSFGIRLGNGSTQRLGLRYNSANDEVTIQQAMSQYNRGDTLVGAGFVATNTAINLRILVDLDATKIYSQWQWEGDASWTTVAAIATKDYLTNGVAGVSMDFEADDWGASDFLNADSFTLTASIPEPATLGLIVASAGGLLVIRRRFMM